MAFSLAFSQAPPDHPFVGEFFPVQLTLIDGDHEIHGGIELPLSLELYYEEKDKQVSKGVFEVEGSKSPKITKNGMCTCKLHITKSSMELDNRRFVLKASAKMKNGSKLEVWSEPLRVMRYRLVIDEGGVLEHDEAETKKMKDAAAARLRRLCFDFGAVWYKDEGGREKCILLNVSLEDGSGSKIKDRPVQLKCLLRYAESGMPVTNQNVLRIWTDSHDKKPSIKLYKGQLAIKARVEDVSKNHQGQSFKIEVMADIDESPTDCDVAPVFSRAVNVRSKRNKRRRQPTSPARSRTPPPVTTTNSFAHAPGVAGWIESVMEGLDQMKWAPDMQQLINPNALIAKLERRYESDVAPHLGPGAAGRKKRKVSLQAPAGHVAKPPMSRARARSASGDDAGAFVRGVSRAAASSAPAASRGAFPDRGPRQGRTPRPPSPVPAFAPPRTAEAKQPLAPRPAAAARARERDAWRRYRTKARRISRAIGATSTPSPRAGTSAGLTLDALDAAERGVVAPFPGADELGSVARSRNGLERDAVAAMASSWDHVASTPSTWPSAKVIRHRLSAGLQPPVVQRGVSSLYTGGPTGDGSGFEDSGVLPPFAATPESLAEEPKVRVILAKRFRPARGTTSLGYPAYDGAKNLVGLYRDNGTDAPVFVPAGHPASLLEDADFPAASKAFDREIENKSACVHDLEKFSSLDSLKEAAFLYCYSKEPWAELDFS